jgi:hypothetical protein
MRALGRQFETGASRQPAFLHALTLAPLYDLLRLNVHKNISTISVKEKTSEQIVREIQCRTPGIYGIYTSTHQVIYIKIDDQHQYLFEPNTGTIKITSAMLFKNAMQRYFDTHDSSREIVVDRYSLQ